MPSALHSLIHRKIVVLQPGAPLAEAARAMCDNVVGCVLVAGEEGGVGGIVTDRDLACRWLTEEGRAAVADARARVEDLMSRTLITASEDDSLAHVIRLMENHGVRRVPIVTVGAHAPPGLQQHELQKHQRFVGIVTLDDLIGAELVSSSQLSRIVRRQFGRKLEMPSAASTVRAQERSAARQSQTLQHFYSYLSEATGCSSDWLPHATYFILGALVTRVTLSAAVHFVAQLPELLRGPLLALPPGPDRTLTARRLVQELSSELHVSGDRAQTLLHDFLAALGGLMSPGALEHLRSQLPRDYRHYFEPVIVHTERPPGAA